MTFGSLFSGIGGTYRPIAEAEALAETWAEGVAVQVGLFGGAQ